MSKVSRYISWAMSVAFTLALFLFFLLKYPYHILFQEQNQLFEWTWDYFAATAAAPGGMADWTGRLLTQFFLSKAAGAAIIALLLAAVQRLCAAAMRAGSLGWYAASFLPAVVLAAYFLDEKALAGAIVAFAIVLSAAVVMSRMTPGKARTVLCIILVPVLYWICGPLAAIFALCLPKGEKWPARLAAVAALASSVAVCLPSTHHTFKALVTGVHYYRYPAEVPGLLWTAAAAAVVMTLLQTVPAPRKQTLRHELPFGIAAAAAVAIAGVLLTRAKADFGEEEMMRYDALVAANDWQGIVDAATAKMPDKPLSVSALNLALAKGNALGDNMFRFNQFGGEGLFPKYSISYTSLLPTAEVYWQLGMVGACQQYTFESQEAIPDFQKSARCYLRLAETNMVDGDLDVARKYLDALGNTAFYRSKAEALKGLCDDPAALAVHPVYGKVMQRRPKDPVNLFNENDKASMLRLLLDGNPDNPTAEQYLLASYLLDKDMDAFAQRVLAGEPESLPRHWQEALLMQKVSTGQPLSGLPDCVSSANRDRMLQFIRDLQSGKTEGMMRKSYGDSYWFYCLFR